MDILVNSISASYLQLTKTCFTAKKLYDALVKDNTKAEHTSIGVWNILKNKNIKKHPMLTPGLEPISPSTTELGTSTGEKSSLEKNGCLDNRA